MSDEEKISLTIANNTIQTTNENKEKISIRGPVVDPTPNSLGKHYNCMPKKEHN